MKMKRTFSNIAKSRQSFGSFHSEDVETLIRLPTAEYRRPKVYDMISEQVKAKYVKFDENNQITLGKSLISQHALYPIDIKEWDFLNHSAFGGTLSPILYENSLWRERVESQPLRFFDRDLFELLVYSLREMAKVIHCSPVNLFPVPNVTTAMNSILQSVEIESGDELLYMNITYGSTKKMLQHYAAVYGGKARQIDIPFPIHSEQEIIDHIISALNAKTRLLILDDITSNTALLLPVQAIAKAVKAAYSRVVVVVDAAHSLFSQPVSLETSNHGNESTDSNSSHYDFWITNCHKWFSAGKGSALLWISPKIEKVKPLIISHGFQAMADNPKYCRRDKLLSSLIWDGCRDYTSFVSLPSVKRVWDDLAGRIDYQRKRMTEDSDSWDIYRDHFRSLLQSVEDMFIDTWKLQPEDFLSSLPFRANTPMRLIPLPSRCLGIDTWQATDQIAFQFQELLHHQYRIEVPVKCLEKRLFVRISAHVYNDRSDYERLAMVVKDWMLK